MYLNFFLFSSFFFNVFEREQRFSLIQTRAKNKSSARDQHATRSQQKSKVVARESETRKARGNLVTAEWI